MHSKNIKNGGFFMSNENLANPAQVGLLGFGMTTILLNLHNAGFYPLDAMILGMGVFFGGLAQLIAGTMEFKKGNTFGQAAFMSYGAFWLLLVFLLLIPKVPAWAAFAPNLFSPNSRPERLLPLGQSYPAAFPFHSPPTIVGICATNWPSALRITNAAALPE